MSPVLDNLLVLVIVGLGLALILNLVRVGRVFGVLGWVIGIAIFSPFVEPLARQIPLWVLVVLVVLLLVFSLRMVLELLVGREGAGSFMGKLAWEVCCFPFRLIRGLIPRRRRD